MCNSVIYFVASFMSLCWFDGVSLIEINVHFLYREIVPLIACAKSSRHIYPCNAVIEKALNILWPHPPQHKPPECCPAKTETPGWEEKVTGTRGKIADPWGKWEWCSREETEEPGWNWLKLEPGSRGGVHSQRHSAVLRKNVRESGRELLGPQRDSARTGRIDGDPVGAQGPSPPVVGATGDKEEQLWASVPPLIWTGVGKTTQSPDSHKEDPADVTPPYCH